MRPTYTTGEVARILGTHPDTIRNYCDSGELAMERGILFTHRRIKRESLITFLQKRGIPGDVIDRKIPKHILIVDDEALVRGMIMQSLKMLDFPFEIDVAENGHQACIQIGYNPPDLIILDLMMPEMDGFQVLESIRKTEISKDIPVMVITGYGEDENIRRISGLGVVDVLRKPFSVADIQNMTIRLLKLAEADKP